MGHAGAGKVGFRQNSRILQIQPCFAVFLSIGSNVFQQHLVAHDPQGIQEILLGSGGIHVDVLHHIVQIGAEQIHNAVGADVDAEGGRNGIPIHGDHILKAQLILLVLRTEFLAGEHIHGGVGQLILHQAGICCAFDHMAGQILGVGNTGAEQRGGGSLLGADNAHHRKFHAVFNQGLHMLCTAGHILPDRVFFVIAVEAGRIHQLKFQIQQFIVGPAAQFPFYLRLFATHDLLDHLLQALRIFQAQSIGHVIGNRVGIRQHKDHFVIAFRPASPYHFILGFQQLNVVDHLIEHIGIHIGGHGGAARYFAEELCRVDLQNILGIIGKDLRTDSVAVTYCGNGMGDTLQILLQIGLEGSQIVLAHLGKHGSNHLPLTHHTFRQVRYLGEGGTVGRQSCRHVVRLGLQCQGIIGQGVRLDLVNIVLKAGGQRHDQGYADDADGAGKRSQQGSCQLGPQVVETQRQGGEPAHRGPTHILVLGRCQHRGIHFEGIGIVDDSAVLHPDDSVGVFFSQLRVVGDHDHQTVPGHFLQKFHDLDAGFRVKGAGGLVSQEDVRVIDQGAGNGNALHLAAGHLIGLLVDLIAQTHFLQSGLCPLLPLGAGDAGNGQGQLHIGQDALMGDQVVALENEADGMVPVGIPVPVVVFFGGDAVDDQITAVIPVKAADDVQKRGLAGAGGAQNGHEFIVPQIQTHPVQSSLHQISRYILFSDILNLQHSDFLISEKMVAHNNLILVYHAYVNKSTSEEKYLYYFSL